MKRNLSIFSLAMILALMASALGMYTTPAHAASSLLLADNFDAGSAINDNLAARQTGSHAAAQNYSLSTYQGSNCSIVSGVLYCVDTAASPDYDFNSAAGDSTGGIRVSVKIKFNTDNALNSSWACVELGNTTATRLNFAPNASFSACFRANGKFFAYDSGTVLTTPEPNWAADGDYTNQWHTFEVYATDSSDNDPFNGSGDTRFDVFADGNTAVYSYTKPGGYAHNYIALQAYKGHQFDNLDISNNVQLQSGCLIGGAIRPFTLPDTLPANDDGSSASAVPLGFTMNFYGTDYNSVWVNNNGNVTFDAGLPSYTPEGMGGVSYKTLAPFFADVDTSSTGTVSYGQVTVNGHPAFAVNWHNVGYFDAHSDKVNDFQLVIIDRSDRAAKDWDFEYNYGQIQWETGDASGGTGGFGGTSAVVGFSDGSAGPYDWQKVGSLVPGSFLDSNLTSGLIYSSPTSTFCGRKITPVQGGIPAGFHTITGSLSASGAGAQVTYDGGVITADGSGNYSITVSDGWTGTITPTLAGITFSPASITISTPVTSDLTGQNFTVPAPEIGLSGNGVNIPNGDTTPATNDFTDFGSVNVDTGSVKHGFGVDNFTGVLDLHLTGTPIVSLGGANAADFTVTTMPGATVTPGNYNLLEITFDPSAIGLRTATVTIASDDADENPFTFDIQGTGAQGDTTPPNTTIVTKPANPSITTSATFAFSGTDNVSAPSNLAYYCKMDSNPYAYCGVAVLFTNLSIANHTLSVYAVDEAGNPDPTPATYTWRIVKERVLNGGFNTYAGAAKIPTNWTATNFATTDGKYTAAKKEGIASVKIAGVAGKTKTLTQTLTLSGIQNETLRFSFWSKGATIPATGICQAQVLLYSGTVLKTTKTVNCKTGTYAIFEKTSLTFNAPSAFNKVVIKFIYAKSSGTLYLDLVSFLK